ncbi:MAG: glycoside hydrolase family 5 protein [Erysipelotrichaceae bacterium]|nr:glycoside hydrolase family 5 protein [Erysipelotrichaceae bacterium]
MKKIISLFICLLLLSSCASSQKESFDGKDRPSSRGALQVIDGKLCGEDGRPVMLRGISSYGLSLSERYINDDCFHDISHLIGANIFRLALYTWGVGSVGYCTGADQKRLMKDIDNGVAFARNNDMYVIIDWHILEDGDPNRFIEEAKIFFEDVSNRYKDEKHVLYEICNEPNKVEWKQIRDYAEVIIPIIRNNDPDSIIIVGTPNWSQDVDIAANDPLDYDDLLYTLHFYSASHKESLREKAHAAIDKKLPIFVTEFGITASTGNVPIDIEEADIWIDFLEDNGISYVMWEFSKTAEASAAIRTDCLKDRGFEREDFSTAGQWLMDTIKERSKTKK